MAEVSIKNVSKRYPNGTLAVSDFNLQVQDKEFLVLVGPSGCGKSTVLRMIAGLEDITEGEIYIGDDLSNGVPPRERDIAMVFQNYALYPHMTVKENLEFGLKLSRKFNSREIQVRVEEAADILDIGDLLDRRPSELSGGQRQRVALGRCIVRKPRVFLFDEPLSNLDAKMRLQMRVEIGKLHARLQTTMIYVTHDQTEAMTMGDRIVCMKDGLIQQIAEPIQLYNEPVNEYVAGFIGTPSMNVIQVKVDEENSLLSFHGQEEGLVLGSKDLQLIRGAENVHIGVRPEHFIQVPESKNSILTYVEVVEPLGSETYVYANSAMGNIVFRVQSEDIPNMGDTVYLRPAAGKMHFFDEQSGVRLVHEEQE